MLLQYLKKRQQVLNENTNYYTSGGVQVFFKDKMANELVDIEDVTARFESMLPDHIRDGVEMIIIGQFEEFQERNINAFYKDGALYVSNFQSNNDDILDDLVHETAHSLEEAFGYEIYADEKIKKEFIRKRMFLYDILWKMDFKAPKELFLNSEYEQEFDEFLLKDVGYDKLSEILRGVFISPYSATSLREYFATGFTEFYLYPNSHNYLKRISPELYKKLLQIHALSEA